MLAHADEVPEECARDGLVVTLSRPRVRPLPVPLESGKAEADVRGQMLHERSHSRASGGLAQLVVVGGDMSTLPFSLSLEMLEARAVFDGDLITDLRPDEKTRAKDLDALSAKGLEFENHRRSALDGQRRAEALAAGVLHDQLGRAERPRGVEHLAVHTRRAVTVALATVQELSRAATVLALAGPAPDTSPRTASAPSPRRPSRYRAVKVTQ